MSLTYTDPHLQPADQPGTAPSGPEGWRAFSDADARRDAIAADLALDLLPDPVLVSDLVTDPLDSDR
jgi:hypothetical protein